MRNIHSNKIKVGELDIHYLSGGQGDPLLVIHGGSSGASPWIENMRELARNYTVYVPDLPGFGDSQPLEGDYYIPELVEFVDKFSQNLGLKSFHLMGHSLGGGIALSYALKFPHKIKKLVLVSSLCLGHEIALWVRFLASRALILPAAAVVFAVMRSIKWLANLFFASAEFVAPFSKTSMQLGRYVTTTRNQTIVLLNRLSEIMMPTLIVWGAKDQIVPAKHAYAAAQLISDCQVKVFEDCGHNVYSEKVQEFSQLLTKFLG